MDWNKANKALEAIVIILCLLGLGLFIYDIWKAWTETEPEIRFTDRTKAIEGNFTVIEETTVNP